MIRKTNSKVIPILSALSFILMVTVNALANILPINGNSSGEVSDAYPNLFAPAGLTFAIWGLIYLLLIGYILYENDIIKDKSRQSPESTRRIGQYFIISSLANSVWIFSWHYRQLPLSLILISVILLSLIAIHLELQKLVLTTKQKFFLKLPFSIYFGWLTVATIANVTTLLASLHFKGFGIPEPYWMVVVLLVSLAITGTVVLKSKDAAYGAVIVWAYAGILNKHLSTAPGFGSAYPIVILTVGLCIAAIVVAIIMISFQRDT
jgi:hypothetical protein